MRRAVSEQGAVGLREDHRADEGPWINVRDGQGSDPKTLTRHLPCLLVTAASEPPGCTQTDSETRLEDHLTDTLAQDRQQKSAKSALSQ